ncbi:MAG TPA: hypothetical protein VN408_20590 [Actinoplanes sp.]|nr:hypothetical protein [Actinoplanes sp.]
MPAHLTPRDRPGRLEGALPAAHSAGHLGAVLLVLPQVQAVALLVEPYRRALRHLHDAGAELRA